MQLARSIHDNTWKKAFFFYHEFSHEHNGTEFGVSGLLFTEKNVIVRTFKIALASWSNVLQRIA